MRHPGIARFLCSSSAADSESERLVARQRACVRQFDRQNSLKGHKDLSRSDRIGPVALDQEYPRRNQKFTETERLLSRGDNPLSGKIGWPVLKDRMPVIVGFDALHWLTCSAQVTVLPA